jgi:hypothetical protein
MIRGLSPGPMLPPARQPDDAVARRKKIAQALMQPQLVSPSMSPQFSFAVGRNFSDMYYSPQQAKGAIQARPIKGLR